MHSIDLDKITYADMPKENFIREANESGMLDHIFVIYGNTLRKNDFDYTSCSGLYLRCKGEDCIKEENNDSNPKVTKTKKHYKPE